MVGWKGGRVKGFCADVDVDVDVDGSPRMVEAREEVMEDVGSCGIALLLYLWAKRTELTVVRENILAGRPPPQEFASADKDM